MRAFMSKPGDGPIYYDGDTLAYADGTTFPAPYWERDSAEAIRLSQFAAEREARAILAETEPATYHTRQCSLAELPAEAWERLGLAEALAAFVEG